MPAYPSSLVKLISKKRYANHWRPVVCCLMNAVAASMRDKNLQRRQTQHIVLRRPGGEPNVCCRNGLQAHVLCRQPNCHNTSSSVRLALLRCCLSSLGSLPCIGSLGSFDACMVDCRSCCCACRDTMKTKEKTRKEKITPFGVNSMRSQVLYQGKNTTTVQFMRCSWALRPIDWPACIRE